jgi:hypothetical protein
LSGALPPHSVELQCVRTDDVEDGSETGVNNLDGDVDVAAEIDSHRKKIPPPFKPRPQPPAECEGTESRDSDDVEFAVRGKDEFEISTTRHDLEQMRSRSREEAECIEAIPATIT